jgi:hypothetical protein
MAEILFTNLPVAVSLDGSEVVPIDQSNGDGTYTTKRTTTGAIAAQVSGVTEVSVANANGFTGNVSDPTTTPIITIESTVTGLVKANGTAQSAAVEGVDYYAPGGTKVAIADGGTGQGTANNALNALLPDQTGHTGFVLQTDGTDTSWVSVSGTGTVTSVGLSAPSEFSVSGSPVTISGTLGLDWADQSANIVFAGPATGIATTPGFRALVTADLPTSGVTAATYGDGTHVAQVTVDNKGRVTSASSVAITHVGDVTSVGLSLPADFTVTGSPVTSSGTLTGAWTTTPTGTGAMVRATSPTLVTPALGTPSSVTLTNGTGLPISTGVSGLGTGVATFLGTPSSANLKAAVTDETGSGALVFATSPTLVTPALGTPSSATLTNATGLPIATGVSGLGTGVATFLGTPSSANLAAAVTDETGSGALVFATSPSLTTPNLGTPSAINLANGTNLPASGLASTTGSGAVALETYATYTPTWSASGTAPSLGNGTLSGTYTKTGKLVVATIAFTVGSTTTFGSGVWRFSLPFNASTDALLNGAGAVFMLHTGSSFYTGVAKANGTANGIEVIVNGSGNQVGPTSPFTWASTDQLSVTVTYQATS